MGILARPLEMIRGLNLPRGFSVCELGDQYVTAGPAPFKLASEFYAEIGCGTYCSIDGNGRGDVTHDLNKPLTGKKGQYDEFPEFDLATDFGTGEHVFDQVQVWRTLHQLVKVGGYIAFDRPTAGYPGHCYYLIKPELVRDLAAANSYDVVHLEEFDTTRGSLIRGVLRKARRGRFVIPQQGRYKSSLVI